MSRSWDPIADKLVSFCASLFVRQIVALACCLHWTSSNAIIVYLIGLAATICQRFLLSYLTSKRRRLHPTLVIAQSVNTDIVQT